MARLEEITKDSVVRGILPNALVTIVDAKWYGNDVVEATYKGPDGKLGNELLYRDREPQLEVEVFSRPWSFTGDAEMFRLVSEALRIRLAHLFDPVLAVHTSLVEPLPHQITAVYEEMLTRQPLRYLLADDPGAGKTIMAGLFIKELLIRGDVKRCMIVAPGSLVEQWQDELLEKFQLRFEVMTNDKLESSASGNWLNENPLVICRLDKLSRNELLQEKLEATDWDLVVVDEAHKMSASFFGGEVKETKRYKLGRQLGRLTRHLLLMSATPHNGKEEDFQLFLALLDSDRFEGRFRDGVHVQDASDLMRRMVKEQLLRFDERPLFPERRAYTVNYKLSDDEAGLYEAVSKYVREEFNRVQALENNGRMGTVGFALTILQRRLASSPEAIFQSLKRRRQRLEARLEEEKLLKRGAGARLSNLNTLPSLQTDDEIEDFEDQPGDDLEQEEELIVDQATAAATIAELETEIKSLHGLEDLAKAVRQSGTDRKWEELSSLLSDNEHMFDENRNRRKLVIFTEHRDTLNYLTDRIRTLLGSHDAVVTISGGMLREERRKMQERFTQDKDTLVLIATDAAGEGINLQRAHLMVNYDLPWNPNRLEQRFGRIHRIGQTEVCHLWNLVADETREGQVFQKLLEKLEVERAALGGAVFDVLGQAIEGRQLRELLKEAIFYGNLPEVRERLLTKVENALDHARLRNLIENRALSHDTIDPSRIAQIREDMERANARRLQPHFISAFFISAFEHLGGRISEREPKRYEIKRVPSTIRMRDRIIGTRETVLTQYERVAFEKTLLNLPGYPTAAFVCPGHPLLDATIDLVLERYRDLLKQGTILIDEQDPSDRPRVLFYLEHSIQDASQLPSGDRRVVSRRMQFVSIDSDGNVSAAGDAPYLDYRPPTVEERERLDSVLKADWLSRDIEKKAIGFAISDLVPRHFQEIKGRREKLIEKTERAVRERLTKEIAHWDNRAQELKAQEDAGRTPNLNSRKAQERADELQARMQKRLHELEEERKLSPQPPVVVGGSLIIPAGMLARPSEVSEPNEQEVIETRESELLAMQAVMEAEKALGHEPRDVSALNCGYDIESRDIQAKRLRFVEVKGRVVGADTVTLTRNEIVTGINASEGYILAIVPIENSVALKPVYVRNPFEREPDFGATSVNYKLSDLLARGTDPN